MELETVGASVESTAALSEGVAQLTAAAAHLERAAAAIETRFSGQTGLVATSPKSWQPSIPTRPSVWPSSRSSCRRQSRRLPNFARRLAPRYRRDAKRYPFRRPACWPSTVSIRKNRSTPGPSTRR
jgi:hypothetical protein